VRTEDPLKGVEETLTCITAERGYLLFRELKPAPTGRALLCEDADFRQDDGVMPLDEVLFGSIWQAARVDTWPPATVELSTPAPTRGTLRVGGRDVPVFVIEETRDMGTARRVARMTYAADPWHASLAGLPLELRMGQLTMGSEEVDAAGQRMPGFSLRLQDWGTWVK
jgi:hypothetical protein